MTTRNESFSASRRYAPRLRLGRALAWIVLGLWILLTLFPLYWIARVAFSTQKELLSNPASLLPVHFTVDAFRRVLGMLPLQTQVDQGGFTKILHFDQYLFNSCAVTLTVTIVSVSVNAMAAYAFARLRFPLRNAIFYVYLAIMVMPTVLNLIPNFLLVKSLGWVGTLQGIMAPGLLGSAFGVFLLRQFFMGINRELEEAARLDGDSLYGVFWHVIVPLSVPALVTLAILTFTGGWNELQWAYFAGGQGRIETATTLPVALLAFRASQQTGLPDWTGMMAGTLMSIVPILGLFVIFGRQMVDSIQFTGFK
jgi:multiple sugar transport system permease protein